MAGNNSRVLSIQDSALRMSLQPLRIESEVTLLDRYKIQVQLNEDSISQYFLAVDQHLAGSKSIIRFLKHSRFRNTAPEKFALSARSSAVAGSLSFHIVKILNYGIYSEQYPFYVYENFHSLTLKALLTSQSLPPKQLLSIYQQVAVGLDSAHRYSIRAENQPIVHGDLKPANILLFRESQADVIARIQGFGLSNIFLEETQDIYLGTPAYSSPEQFEGFKTTGGDIYSLGVMMFQGLTGQLPINPAERSLQGWRDAHRYRDPLRLQDTASAMQLPKALIDVVHSCLEKKPENRPETALQVAEVLEMCLINSGSDRLASDRSSDGYLRETSKETVEDSLNEFSQILWDTRWPKHLPNAEISFAQLLTQNCVRIPAVLAMLSESEINLRRSDEIRSYFYASEETAAMLLWSTVWYEAGLAPRWFINYLDLTNLNTRVFVRLLLYHGEYPLILFGATSCSDEPARILYAKLTARQQLALQISLNQAEEGKQHASPAQAKATLRAKLAPLKVKILYEIELENSFSFSMENKTSSTSLQLDSI